MEVRKLTFSEIRKRTLFLTTRNLELESGIPEELTFASQNNSILFAFSETKNSIEEKEDQHTVGEVYRLATVFSS